MIEPSAVRFTIGTKVIPPKQHKPVQRPKLSMPAEAAQVRARFNKKWGRYAQYTEGNDPNEARRILAQDRRERMAAVIMALINQHGEMTLKAISVQLNEPDEQIRYVMRIMGQRQQIVMGRRTRDGHVWRKGEKG